MDANTVPIDVILAFICIFIFGFCLGAIVFLPIIHKNSDIPLEKLSGDWIWRYVPDWVISLIGCIIFILLSFILISGMWRT